MTKSNVIQKLSQFSCIVHLYTPWNKNGLLLALFRNYEPTVIVYLGFSSLAINQLHSLLAACTLPTPSQINLFHFHTHAAALSCRDEEGDTILSLGSTPPAAGWWSQKTPMLGSKCWSFTVQRRVTTIAHTPSFTRRWRVYEIWISLQGYQSGASNLKNSLFHCCCFP